MLDKRIRMYVIWLVCVLSWLMPSMPCLGHQLPVKQILVIDSHSHNDGMGRRLSEGVQQVLAGKEFLAAFEHISLNGQVDNEQLAEDIRHLQVRLAHGNYDLVLLNSTLAANLFLDKKLHVSNSQPIVTTIYYGDLKRRIQESEVRMTGLQSPLSLAKNLELGLQLRPGISKAVLIIGAQFDIERSPGLSEQLQLARNLNCPLDILSGNDYSTAEMLCKLEELSPESALVIYHSWGSSRDELFHGFALMPVIRSHFSGLVFSPIYRNMELGAAGGYLLNAREQGNDAGEMVVRLLRNEPIANIPVGQGRLSLQLNHDELERLGIDMDRLPTTAILLNKPESWLAHNGQKMVAFFIVVVILLIMLLGFHLGRQREMDRMQLLIDNLPLRVSILNSRGENVISHVPENDHVCRHGGSEGHMDCPDCEFMKKNIRKCREMQRTLTVNYTCCQRHRQAQFIPLVHSEAFGHESVLVLSFDTQELNEMRRKSEEQADQLRCTLTSIGDGVIVTDCNGCITLMNEAASRMTGYRREDVMGKLLEEQIHLVNGMDGTRVPSPVMRALSTNQVVELTNHTDLVRTDGSRLPIADSAAPITDIHGKILGAVMVFRDMTGEYDRMDRLNRDNSSLKQAMKLGNFACVTLGRDGIANITGVKSGLWPYENDRRCEPEEWVVPEDLPAFKQAWKELISGTSDTLHVSYAACRPGEERRYFNMSFERIESGASGMSEFCGVLQEITAFRRQELELRDQTALLNHIMDNLPVCVFVKDAGNDFRYLMCNSAMEQFSGWPVQDIIGKRDDELFTYDEKQLRFLQQADGEAMTQQERYVQEENFTNASGDVHWMHTIKVPMIMPSGDKLLLGVSVDMTKRHELELSQQRTIETLNRYVSNERLLKQILTSVLSMSGFRVAIRECLRLIGECYDADRVFLFSYSEANSDVACCEGEWCTENVSSKDLVNGEFNLKLLPGWRDNLMQNNDILVSDIEHPPAEVAQMVPFFKARHLQSLLVSDISVQEQHIGYIGVAMHHHRHEFTEFDLQLMHAAAAILGLAMVRHRQWHQLSDSKEFLKQVINTITLPLTIIDKDYRIILANPAAAAQGNLTPEEAVGTLCYNTLCGYGSPMADCIVTQTLKDQMSHTRENDMAGKHMVSTSQPLYDSRGNLKYIMTLDIDMTNQVEQRRVLKDALDKANAMNRAKNSFFATVSHELRTPLNAVIALSELLQSGDLGQDERCDYLQSINSSANALLALVNDVLDINRQDANQLTLSPKPWYLPRLIQEVMSMFKLRAIEKRLHLDYSCYGLSGIRVILDGERLRQVLHNLLGNATRFTFNGKVSLKADYVAVQGTTLGTLTIHVIDTGCGVPLELQPRIFEPFVRDAASGENIRESTGLGLNIAKRLISQMGGTIKMTSVVNQGTTFTITLKNVPCEISKLSEDNDDVALERSIVGEGKSLQTPEQTRTFKVLVVDDIILNLKVFGALLQRLGHTCIKATSAANAREILQSGEQVDMVFTDAWMPGENGEELAMSLKNDPRFAQLPIVAVSADTQLLENRNPIFADVLLKPINVDSITAVIDRVMFTPPHTRNRTSK